MNRAGSPLTTSNSCMTPNARGRLVEHPSRFGGRSLLLIGELRAVQLVPLPGRQTKFTNERKTCKLGQRFLLEEDAMESEAEQLREFCRRADDRPFARTVVQMHDDPVAVRSGCHAHVPPGGSDEASRPNACRALANAASRSSTSRFTVACGYRPSAPRSPAASPVSSWMPWSMVRIG